jgi:hypothetical protein
MVRRVETPYEPLSDDRGDQARPCGRARGIRSLIQRNGHDKEIATSEKTGEEVLRAEVFALVDAESRADARPLRLDHAHGARQLRPGSDEGLVLSTVGAVWAPGGQPRVVFGFTITRGKIVAIDLVADPDQLHQIDLVVLHD